jgi:hypothetical protein
MRLLAKLSLLAAVLASLTCAAGAQKPAELKKQLADMEAKAKDDVAGLLEAAKWAREHGLEADANRVFQKVLKLDPTNETAHLGLGFVKFDGKWMPKDKADSLQKQQEEASFAAKGLKKVDGVWVAENEVADAKKGIFHHEGQIVGKAEKLALMGGSVRHPRTGMLIAKEDAAKAEKQFPVGEGRWVDEAEANSYHSNAQRPWAVRTQYATVLSTLPIETIENEIRQVVDSSIETVRPVFGGKLPAPAHRPTVLVIDGTDAYREVGNQIGAEGSSYGAFYAEGELDLDASVGVGKPRPAVANWLKDWGPYYVRHASGMAYVHGLLADAGAEGALWFTRGIGSLAERFYAPGVAKHFGSLHVQKGGVKNLGEFFGSFTISGELESRQIDYNVFQAGLALSFARDGGDKQSTAALQEVTEAFEKSPKNIEKAIQKLEKTLVKKEAELRAHLQKLVSG